MKKPICLFSSILLCILGNLLQPVYAQAPEKFNYQAIIRDADDEVVANQEVSLRISILQGNPFGSFVFVETHKPITNQFGLVNLFIGGGTVLSGSISGIDWGSDVYFMKIEIDPSGGSSYTDMSTTQLLSVPYALHAKTAETVTETDPVFTAHSASGITAGHITEWNTAYGWGNHALAGYVPNTRTLTINGITYDLTANNIWNVGTVSSVGLSLPDIFSVSGSPVTSNGTLTLTLASQTANKIFASPDGSSGLPGFRALAGADIPGLDWSKITTGKPTTLGGYGITDAVSLTGNQTIAGNKTFSNTITASNGINANSKIISNLAAPVNATDAANKSYVDDLLQRIDELESQPGIIRDIDGNLYTTVKIGDQVWMVENLKTTRYRDGTDIPLVTDNTAWINLITPGYCWYDNNEASYKNKYGALYNWYTVSTGKLCPVGWHVPTDVEWTIMENYLIANGYNYDGTTTGNKIGKSVAATIDWMTSTNTGAIGNDLSSNNSSGFTALPAGRRYLSGTFQGFGYTCVFWTATEYDDSDAWKRRLDNIYVDVYRNWNLKIVGSSVRCIRD